MKIAIARLGLLSVLSLFTNTGFAYSVSDLLISEIMANPAALADSEGEWFELYNPTDQGINLRDTWIGDDGGDLHRFDTDLLILPAAYLTLARGPHPGFVPDYVYADFILANIADEIIFGDASGELLRLDYESGFVLPGQSMELIGHSMQTRHYMPTPNDFTFAGRDVGTPAAAGSFRFGVVPVSAPATLWLVVCGLVALALGRATGVSSRLRPVVSTLRANARFALLNLRSMSWEGC